MQRQILICTQQRYAPNPVCCANQGGIELKRHVEHEVKRMALDLEVLSSGCMGMCLQGPNLKLMPDGKVWNAVRLEQAVEIVNILSCI
jgi:(2Fe-2S) ferredoxin